MNTGNMPKALAKYWRTHKRRKRSASRRRNPIKLERFLGKVKRRGSAYSPYAVCKASLSRKKNPRGFRLFVTIGKQRLFFDGRKFSKHASPVTFTSLANAKATAQFMMRRHRSLRGRFFGAKSCG